MRLSHSPPCTLCNYNSAQAWPSIMTQSRCQTNVIRLLLTALVLLLASRRATTEGYHLRGGSGSLLCQVVEVHVLVNYGEHESLECDLIFPEEDIVVHGLPIHLPADLVQENQDALRSGDWFIQIPDATIEETYIPGFGVLRSGVRLAQESQIMTIPPEEGRLISYSVRGRRPQDHIRLHARRLDTMGQRTVLVVRVSTSDASPTYTASQLSQYFFDTKGYSMVRQYQLCSMGALQFQPFDFFSQVIDVVIPGQVASFTRELLWSAANAAASSERNVASLDLLSDHVAFILPSGTQGGYWIASGTTGSWRSIYNDTFGGMPNTVMHEVGHNLGMGHAGMGSDVYADTTDIMGYGDLSQFGPSKCFNGVHLWFLQWYSDRSVEVDPWSNQLLNLASFVDYRSTSNDQYVVIKVDTLYLVYNRVKGVNNGTQSAQNQVTVSLGKAGAASTRLAGLDNTTAPFQVINYGGSSQSLTIAVCSLVYGPPVDYAVVSIGVNGPGCL